MGRKKTVIKPQPPQTFFEDEKPKKPLKDRKVVMEKGNWEVFKDGKGFVKVKFKATFADDPEGCRGYGVTEKEATEVLFAYESL